MADEAKPDEKKVPDGGDGADQKAGAKKILFDQDQQTFLNNHGDEMFGKGFKRAESIMGTKLSEAQTAIEALQKQLDEAKQAPKKEPKAAADDKPVTPSASESQLLAQLEELKATTAKMRTDREALDARLAEAERVQAEAAIRREFVKGIPKGVKFFDVDEAIALSQRDHTLQAQSDGSVVVINPKTGQPRLGADASPMTMSAFIAEVVSRKPYLVESGVSSGAGSSESREMRREDGIKPPNELPADEFQSLVNRVKAGERVI